MKKLTLTALSAAAIVCATIPPAQADLNSELGGFFNSMGAAGNNVTSPQAWQGQAATYVTGGGIYVRSANKTIQLASITLPSLNAGCGGIDAFLGSFSFISKDEFVAFAKNIISAAPGLFFDLGLKTVTPMLASAKDYLQQLASDVNSMNMSSCQAARGIVGGLWPATQENKDDLCKTIGTGDGNMFTDWAAARQGCGVGNQASKAESKVKDKPEYKDLILTSKNVVWDMLERNALFKGDRELKEMAITLTGTVIFDAQSHPITVPSRAGDTKLVKAIMDGGDAEIYRCSDTSECLKMTVKTVSIRAENGLNRRVASLISGISAKAKSDKEGLSEKEKAFINSTSIPILSYIMDPLSLGMNESVAMRMSTYIAHDMLIKYMREIIDETRGAINGKPLNKEAMSVINDNISIAYTRLTQLQNDIQIQQSTLQSVMTDMSYMRQQLSSRMLSTYQSNYRFEGGQ
ncbi:conjugal transfer protein TraH [Klebsiella sp. PL-2018]|uniref:conjugal transfer protein TraH n=2 Tax=Klebsiella sp. PL-2018 TaxID=2851540 RepID=UPI001C210AA3|nr:conjugal transfer protein TraH [Klebsiella sp. PL-2018]QXD01296.1 IncF plasmid conjugative transfer pilus assembly protein TraH [Klebsiella sp. PL-2018]